MNTVAVTDAAIAQADAGVDPAWKARALQALKDCALQNPMFTVDDVWAFLPEKTRENRAMGAIMRQGVKLGWIVSTGQYALSQQAQCHRNPRTLWRSLI